MCTGLGALVEDPAKVAAIGREGKAGSRARARLEGHPPPIEAFTSTPEPLHSPAARTDPREREVFALIANGLSNQEIAATLHLSPLTARTHVSRILTKL